MAPEGARGCQTVPDGARRRQTAPDGARRCQMVPDSARRCQTVSEGARGCQTVIRVFWHAEFISALKTELNPTVFEKNAKNKIKYQIFIIFHFL